MYEYVAWRRAAGATAHCYIRSHRKLAYRPTGDRLVPVRVPSCYASLHRTTALVAVLSVAGCAGEKSGTSSTGAASSASVDAAAGAITSEGLMQHIADLSADSMEGRGPGTAGEQKAVAYMQSQFKALGLKPGNPDGTYL